MTKNQESSHEMDPSYRYHSNNGSQSFGRSNPITYDKSNYRSYPDEPSMHYSVRGPATPSTNLTHEKLICHQCGDRLPNVLSLHAHLTNFCRGISKLPSQYFSCPDCSMMFPTVDLYNNHLQDTRHGRRSQLAGDVSPPSQNKYPIQSTRPQIIHTPFSTPPQRDIVSTRSMPVPQGKAAILTFGAVVKKNLLVGGASWWLSDFHTNAMMGNGSDPVIQTFPSKIRMEYEALLNGLKAAFLKNVRVLYVKGSSELVINQFSYGRVCPYLKTMYHSVDDLKTAISKLLPQFQRIEFELISNDINTFCNKLSENIIADFLKRKESKLAKSFLGESVPVPTLTNNTTPTTTTTNSLTNATTNTDVKSPTRVTATATTPTITVVSRESSSGTTVVTESILPSKTQYSSVTDLTSKPSTSTINSAADKSPIVSTHSTNNLDMIHNNSTTMSLASTHNNNYYYNNSNGMMISKPVDVRVIAKPTSTSSNMLNQMSPSVYSNDSYGNGNRLNNVTNDHNTTTTAITTNIATNSSSSSSSSSSQKLGLSSMMQGLLQPMTYFTSSTTTNKNTLVLNDPMNDIAVKHRPTLMKSESEATATTVSTTFTSYDGADYSLQSSNSRIDAISNLEELSEYHHHHLNRPYNNYTTTMNGNTITTINNNPSSSSNTTLLPSDRINSMRVYSMF